MTTRIVYRNTRHGVEGLKGGQFITREQYLRLPWVVEQVVGVRVGADRALVSDQAASRLAPPGFDHGERNPQ